MVPRVRRTRNTSCLPSVPRERANGEPEHPLLEAMGSVKRERELVGAHGLAGVTTVPVCQGLSVLKPEKSQANRNVLVTLTKSHLEDKFMVIEMRKWFSLGWRV